MFQIRLQKVKKRIEMPLNKMKIINYESNIVSILRSILMGPLVAFIPKSRNILRSSKTKSNPSK
jgi:hypothetical protein